MYSLANPLVSLMNIGVSCGRKVRFDKGQKVRGEGVGETHHSAQYTYIKLPVDKLNQ